LSKELRIALEFTAGAFLAIFILVPMRIDTNVATGISIACGILLTVLIERGRDNKKSSAKNNLSYNKGNNTLTLKARRPENANVVKVEEMVNYSMKYHPSEIVYTGATVGGVHTGGFHEAGNYYSVNGSGTQKYQLVYTGIGVDQGDYCPVSVIKLDAPLIQEARKNPAISRYLKSDGSLVLSNETASKYGDHMKTAAAQGNTALVMQMAKADYFNQQLSRDQCNTIKNWLCANP